MREPSVESLFRGLINKVMVDMTSKHLLVLDFGTSKTAGQGGSNKGMKMDFPPKGYC